MSLESLRQYRRQGQRPSLVKLVVGASAAVGDGPDLIAISADARADRMDWRAVIGLPLALFVADGADAAGEQAFDAAVAAGAQPLGACWRDGAVSTNEEVRAILPRMWEVLCLC